MKKVLATLAMAVMACAANAQNVKVTNGGIVIKDSSLSYNGKIIPLEEDIMSVGIVGKYNNLNKDVILFSQTTGGTACPATYFFLTIDASGAKKSNDFGTCSDLAKVSPGTSEIVVTMPSMQGKLTKYVYKQGQVFENGKLAK